MSIVEAIITIIDSCVGFCNIFLDVVGFWCPPIRDKMDPHHGIMKAFPKVKRAKVLQGKDPPPAKKKPDECDVTGRYQ